MGIKEMVILGFWRLTVQDNPFWESFFPHRPYPHTLIRKIPEQPSFITLTGNDPIPEKGNIEKMSNIRTQTGWR